MRKKGHTRTEESLKKRRQTRKKVKKEKVKLLVKANKQGAIGEPTCSTNSSDAADIGLPISELNTGPTSSTLPEFTKSVIVSWLHQTQPRTVFLRWTRIQKVKSPTHVNLSPHLKRS